jgi:hypothetical protein
MGDDSYILVTYKFDNFNGDEFILPFDNLSKSGSTISFNSDFAWSNTQNLYLGIVLYSGQGSKSSVINLTVPRPNGALRIANPTVSSDTIPAGYINNN